MSEPQPASAGSFEFRAHSLLAVGRQVGEAFADYQPARTRLEEAWRRCGRKRSPSCLPPRTGNGELDAAAANRLLTGALARADKGRHETAAETTETPANE